MPVLRLRVIEAEAQTGLLACGGEFFQRIAMEGRDVNDVVGLALDPNIANPSWCLDVITMYFMPEFLAIATHSSALNFTGSNRGASCSYSRTGILAWFMIHSPRPGTGCPFHWPAGTA